MVESYGTRVQKIRRLYTGYPLQPVFQEAEGAFKVQLFDRNEQTKSLDSRIEKAPFMYLSKDEEKKTVPALAKIRGRITRKELEIEFGYGTTKAYDILKSLCNDGSMIQQKRGNRTIYIPQN